MVCSKCGAERKVPGTGRYGIEVCSACSLAASDALLKRICPAIYLKTDLARLPVIQYEKAMQWQMGPTGLLLTGPTGLGKTRIAWTLIEKLIKDGSLKSGSIKAFSCVSFSHELNRAYKEDNAEDWLESVWNAPLVFFDDLGKLKFTERTETELFGVIDHRTSHELPIIATTNDTGDSMAGRMSDDRGPALIRRLREFCTVIPF